MGPVPSSVRVSIVDADNTLNRIMLVVEARHLLEARLEMRHLLELDRHLKKMSCLAIRTYWQTD